MYMCMCVFESANMRCNNLVLFSKVLKNAASKAECGGCIVHYVLCVYQHACGTTSFFFATTPRIEPNVDTGLRTTRGLM